MKKYFVNMSQHTWNWWFVLNCIACCVLMMFTGFLPIPQEQRDLQHLDLFCLIGWIVVGISFVPCLYIGTKPEYVTED